MKTKWAPILWLLLAAVIIGASLGFAARAEAAPGDTQYITILDRLDIYNPDDALLIKLGHLVCTALDEDSSVAQMVRISTVMVSESHGLYSAEDSGVIMGAAAQAYCPEYWPMMAELAEAA